MRPGPLLLLALVLIACGDARGSGSGAAQPPPKPTPILAIRAPESLAADLREGSFFRWGAPRLSGLRIEMGPEATGDAEVWIDRLPASPAVQAGVKGLPVEIGSEGIVLAGTRYPGPAQSLALRLPGAARPTWVVVGRDTPGLVDLADDVLFRVASGLTGERRGRRRTPLDVDYLLRETPWMERSGRWAQTADGAWTIDSATERNDLAEWDRWFTGLAPIRGDRGDRVVLLVPSTERNRPELTRLAADLDRAAAEMAPRVPVAMTSPMTVVVESDYVAQGRHTGEIGEAVPGTRADLHLVYDAADLPAYRFALAKVLLKRAGLAPKVPVALERGAALWLSRDWYGKPYPDWLPIFAAARVLPEAGELLARQEPADASVLLWTPAAAAVVEGLAGTTVAEKLAQAPSPERTGKILGSLRAGPVPAPNKGDLREPFLKGVSLSMWNSLEGGYHSPSVGEQLDRLAALGANAVSLMPFALQPGPSRPELRYLNRGPGSETDIGLIHATRLSRAKGFHVLYKPHLWVSGNSWPGDVRMETEKDWQAWWRGYRRYILHHALLASWAGADLFSVGCELSKTVDRDAEWRDLIAATRLFFPRAVTYSGNWYGDLENVRFWDRLDYMGIDAYFPLSASPQAGRTDLEKGAKEVAARLNAASKRSGKPMILTEVGFAAHKAAWVAPHTEGGEYSEDDQALAYDVLFNALGRPPWLAGTFVWKAFSAPGSDGGSEADFRFLGRKAEREVREYYKPSL
ncbi:MAG TPA: hypothetical protein VHC97_23620 [Thermoanaerobaculia bacterium]|nr:hypothetical protein [Thermoanaerobaculia bacterium]